MPNATTTFDYGSELRGNGEMSLENILFGSTVFAPTRDYPHTMHNATTSFDYGSELRGNGEISLENIIFGSTVFALATVGIFLGVLNLYFIRTVKIFHCAFGWFWASRTVGEMFLEAVNAVYTGPVSALKRNSYGIIAYTWFCGFLIVPFFFVIPCSAVGYSPQQYTYVFVKCFAGQERDFTYSAFQNVIMVSTLIILVHQNYRNVPAHKRSGMHKALNIMEVISLILTHIANPLSLIVFNPEIRRRLFGKAYSDEVHSITNQNKSAPNSMTHRTATSRDDDGTAQK
uniref:7TM_GPCR_Srx domain-containing protein n=1 Tax=Steinernema glaseri TaxID=37863 RepID=A0A1I7ZDP9_9BILA